jgi:hypothetical protein
VKANLFWDMLSAYEQATILEAKAIGARDFVRLEQLSLQKGDILRKLQAIGSQLGLDRRHAALRERLEALQDAEQINVGALAELAKLLRLESDEVQISRRKLSSLRGVYAADSGEGGFYGEG